MYSETSVCIPKYDNDAILNYVQYRFSIIILIELLTFSVAMYITYLPLPTGPPDVFKNLGVTILTMFKLMLGLTDLEILYDSPHPWLSVTLFVLFTLLTYILLMNALIAMMSNTCSLVSENKISQWELQRLSVVLLLESMLPLERLAYNSGHEKSVIRYDLHRKQRIQEIRFFMKVWQLICNLTIFLLYFILVKKVCDNVIKERVLCENRP